MISDLNKIFGGLTDLVETRNGSVDLHTPIHPPRQRQYSRQACIRNVIFEFMYVLFTRLTKLVIIIHFTSCHHKKPDFNVKEISLYMPFKRWGASLDNSDGYIALSIALSIVYTAEANSLIL